MCDLKSKLEQWREWLYGDDVHSIRNQIHAMIWDAAVFQSINKCRELAPKDSEGEPELNGMVQDFINRGFFQIQVSAIRRLMDRNACVGERSVISLYRLIEDMRKNCGLLKREVIITALGYPYDYQQEVSRIMDLLAADSGGRPRIPPEHLLCRLSQEMHKNIDFLADVEPTRRNPQDEVSEGIFVWLKERLEKNIHIHRYVDKFLAHAATEESRATIDADEIKITLGHILDTHKLICETANFLGINFMNQGFANPLMTPLYDQFRYLENAWVTTDNMQEIYGKWQEYGKRTQEWCDWNWQEEYRLKSEEED